jgi:hypothetical protein
MPSHKSEQDSSPYMMALHVQTGDTRTDALYLLDMLAVILTFLAPAWRQPESIRVTPGGVCSDLAISHWPI